MSKKGIKSLYKDHDDYELKVATLPNGCLVSTYGHVYTPRGVEVHNIPYPYRVEVIPLTWTSRVEERTIEVQCKKLEGSYKRVHSGGTRPSRDGVRSGSDGTWSNTFVNETYPVSVTYKVLIMTSSEGEEVIYSPDLPGVDSLSVWTGYGKQDSYTVDTVPTTPTMPSERVVKHRVSLEEELQHYYNQALEYFEVNPYVPPHTYSVGDVVKHSTLGEGVVVSLCGNFIQVSFNGEKRLVLPSQVENM